MSSDVVISLKRFLELVRGVSPAPKPTAVHVEQLELSFDTPQVRSQPAAAADNCLDEIWQQLQQSYFPDRPDLGEYRIMWSKRRQTSCLASCSIHTRRISVAAAMNLPNSRPHLAALIYHEMCHAVLGPPKVKNGRRVVHGREFKNLECRHPGIVSLNAWITDGGWRNAVRQERKANPPAKPVRRRKRVVTRRRIRRVIG